MTAASAPRDRGLVGVTLLDLRKLTTDLEKSLGVQGSIALHFYLPAGQYDSYPQRAKDDTHYCAYGASRVAEVVAKEIRRLDMPLARWLRTESDWPAHPALASAGRP